jgi:hypothetical protein
MPNKEEWRQKEHDRSYKKRLVGRGGKILCSEGG